MRRGDEATRRAIPRSNDAANPDPFRVQPPGLGRTEFDSDQVGVTRRLWRYCDEPRPVATPRGRGPR